MKRITFKLVLILSHSIFFCGCMTVLRQPLSEISPLELQDKGLIAGRITLYDSKTKAELGGFFGPNFQAVVTRAGEKKIYDALVNNKENGYFGWLVEPGTYWIHYCRINGVAGGEIILADMKPLVQVNAGEITYIGHIHYEIGKTSYLKTIKHNFQSSLMENLRNFGGLLIEVEQRVKNNEADMQNYLDSLAFDKVTKMNVQLVESWAHKFN